MYVLESIDALQQEIVFILISFHSKGVFCAPACFCSARTFICIVFVWLFIIWSFIRF